MNQWQTKLRLVFFQIVVLVAFGVVGLRLWDLQIVSSETYQRSADQNRFRLVPVIAPRGVIYDLNGRQLVRNMPSFNVTILPAGLPDDPVERQRVLERVGMLLEIPATDAQAEAWREQQEEPAEGEERPTAPSSIETRLRQRTINPNTAVTIATNIDRQAALILEEEHLDLPGVGIEVDALREYAEGPLFSHILGYMTRLPAEQVDQYLADPTYNYTINDSVGMAGLEFNQEAVLRGVKGLRHVEVDAFQREIRVVSEQTPERGNSLVLTIDAEFQRAVEEALRKGMEQAKARFGVVVVLDPRDGSVRALVSEPTYDNNLFSGGISYEDYQQLATDRNHPLVNNAISGLFPPGSTFKVIPATGALNAGVVNINTRVVCQGRMFLASKYGAGLGHGFVCWNKAGHGSLNVTGALAQSCNIFFYQVTGGYKNQAGLGIAGLGEIAAQFGLGETLGIPLPGEASGFIPTDRWKRQTFGESWLLGDTYNAAIGQGFILVTPLQLANVYATIANGGTLYQPRLVHQVVSPEGEVVYEPPPQVIRELDVSPQTLAIVRQGLREAVTWGTARHVALPGIDVAAKTGTAEFPGVDEDGRLMLDAQGNLPTHAWFAAFAPYEEPEIALIVFLYGGGEGSRTAAPVAHEVLKAYFGLDEREDRARPPTEE